MSKYAVSNLIEKVSKYTSLSFDIHTYILYSLKCFTFVFQMPRLNNAFLSNFVFLAVLLRLKSILHGEGR